MPDITLTRKIWWNYCTLRNFNGTNMVTDLAWITVTAQHKQNMHEVTMEEQHDYGTLPPFKGEVCVA